MLQLGMLHWLKNWTVLDDTKVIYILSLILFANVIDFLLGWINAKFNKDVVFVSHRATYGIAKKMILFILCIFFVPVAMLIPDPLGITSLYVMLMGYLLTEINSILSHLGKGDDSKQSQVFIDFIGKIFGGRGDGKV